MAAKVLSTFGACTSPSTAARYNRKNLNVLKVHQEEALRTLPDDHILIAATDNAGKQQGSKFQNTLQIFLWSIPPTRACAHLPSGSETPVSAPKITDKEEEELARMNPIYGDAAISEELGNLEGTVTEYQGSASALLPAAPAGAYR